MAGCEFPDCSGPMGEQSSRFCVRHHDELEQAGQLAAVTRICRCGRPLGSKHAGGLPAGVLTDRGYGQCKKCYVPRPRKRVRRLEPKWQPKRHTLEELMSEWEFLRGWVSYEDFGARVGIKQESWERTFQRAKALGDPRAVRARNDPFGWSDPAAGLTHVLDNRAKRRYAA